MPEHEEIEEQIHHAHEPFERTVAGTMAIIAALLAVVSVLGQHFQADRLLAQQQASDQWAYYQAKDIRRYIAQTATDTLGVVKADRGAVDKYVEDSKKYKQQGAEIQEKARDFEKERDLNGKKAVRFHLAEVFLEVAIVLSSLAILTKRSPLFYGGALSAAVGVVIGLTSLAVA